MLKAFGLGSFGSNADAFRDPGLVIQPGYESNKSDSVISITGATSSEIYT
jgi:hypothetical protein